VALTRMNQIAPLLVLLVLALGMWLMLHEITK